MQGVAREGGRVRHDGKDAWHQCGRWAGITEVCPLRGFDEEDDDDDEEPDDQPVKIILPEAKQEANVVTEALAIVTAIEVLRTPAVRTPAIAAIGGTGFSPGLPPVTGLPARPILGGGFKPPEPFRAPNPFVGSATPAFAPSGGSGSGLGVPRGGPSVDVLKLISAAFAVIAFALRVRGGPATKAGLAAAGIIFPDLMPDLMEVEQATTLEMGRRVEEAELGLLPETRGSGDPMAVGSTESPRSKNLFLTDVSQRFVPGNPVFQDVPFVQ